MYLSPRFEIPNSFVLPPVEFWRGTSPRNAANSLPFLKFDATPAMESKAVAVIMPIPGIRIKRLQASFCLAKAFKVCSCSSIC